MQKRYSVCVLKSIIILSGILIFSRPVMAQKTDSLIRQLEHTDLIDFGVWLLNLKKVDRVDKKNPLIFSIIPVSASSAGNGTVAVSAINVSFHLDKKSNLSTVYFYPYTNFAGAYGAYLAPYLWFDENRWNASGDFRGIHNSINDYGLGTSSVKENLTVIDLSQIRTYLSANRKVVKNFYVGGGYALDSYYNVKQSDSTEGDGHFNAYPYGTQGPSVSSGFNLSLLRDNRANPVNPAQGFYTSAVFQLDKSWMGSTYNWSSIYLDTRKYTSFSKTRHKVLAVRAMYWGTYGHVPYLNLPSTFQDKGRAGRGYSTYRFRGKQMLYGEVEYRFDLSNHGFLGGVVFANAQSFSEPTDNKFRYIRPAAGAGLRLKFNRKSDTNVTLDFAWGKDGFNFYINLGEFF